jgi:hypothetical protein
MRTSQTASAASRGWRSSLLQIPKLPSRKWPLDPMVIACPHTALPLRFQVVRPHRARGGFSGQGSGFSKNPLPPTAHCPPLPFIQHPASSIQHPSPPTAHCRLPTAPFHPASSIKQQASSILHRPPSYLSRPSRRCRPYGNAKSIRAKDLRLVSPKTRYATQATGDSDRRQNSPSVRLSPPAAPVASSRRLKPAWLQALAARVAKNRFTRHRRHDTTHDTRQQATHVHDASKRQRSRRGGFRVQGSGFRVQVSGFRVQQERHGPPPTAHRHPASSIQQRASSIPTAHHHPPPPPLRRHVEPRLLRYSITVRHSPQPAMLDTPVRMIAERMPHPSIHRLVR